MRYDAVNAMSLNEFLKAHRRNEEQEATITQLGSKVAQQQKGMEAVIARLKERDSKIEKVRAHLASGKSAPQIANSR